MDKKYVIFLDIDGVLNYSGDTDLIDDTISKKRIEFLKNMNKKYNATCVIISSRRYYKNERETINSIFDSFNLKYEYMSLTYTGLNRKDEIINYLINNLISGFTILDDNDYEYTKDPITNRRFVNMHNHALDSTYKSVIDKTICIPL